MNDDGFYWNVEPKLPTKTPPPRAAWKYNPQKGTASLSYYGLRVTVFPNRRGWGCCVSEGQDSAQTFTNYANEDEARAAAQARFLALKASGRFQPPEPPSLEQQLEKALGLDGHILPDYERVFVEIGDAELIHEGDRADLYAVDGDEWWVPHSQGLRVGDVLIVTAWWFERAEPVDD